MQAWGYSREFTIAASCSARSRLREVFRKTGARRQAELVRLVERLPVGRPA
ncbi:hypothetical protein WQQ_08270 [Hydrocarboniphaga effusa AP103]|uniref:Uncharacterized protein n=1 Tax=Hydrocarboniphaga effusa AP103 TaxID=1172194 RepID=I8TAF5_9GAMM|nr:hypothetical protein WQQ_08270 [Hydrocarboniphaga effusa AP103]